jgi:UDP-glucose 4-epimerase
LTEGIVVTGSSGFIGQELCGLLCKDSACSVLGLDKVTPGSQISSPNFRFLKTDLSLENLGYSLKHASRIFHLAANPEVSIGVSDSNIDIKDNFVATRNLLELLRNSEFRGTFIFASTSTVYGEAKMIPTPESYGPLIPISLYGASKLACESLIFAYANLFRFKAKVVRLANVVGGSSHHGVVYDFIEKLKKNPSRLQVLGDGTQAKSYVHIDDCLDGLLRVIDLGNDIDVFNLGTEQTTNVMKIAKIVIEAMNLENVKIETGFGEGENGRGWPGDVKKMLLDCTKLMSLGWRYKMSSDESIRASAKQIIGMTGS